MSDIVKDLLNHDIEHLHARIAELESFQINFQHATDIDREDYKQRVAELEAERDSLKAELSLAQGAGHAPPQAKP